jgi:hypothetical protein
MPKYKYPAPFDAEEPERLINPLYVVPPGAPQPPMHPGPPLPVSISVDKPATVPTRSYYKDLFGEDLSVIALSLDTPWATDDHRRLAIRILNGETSINRLSPEETRLIDDLATSYTDHGGINEEVRQEPRKRLRVSDEDPDPGGEDDPDMQSEGDDVLRGEMSTSITNAYGYGNKEG